MTQSSPQITLKKSEPVAITDQNQIQIEQQRSYQLNTRILQTSQGCQNNCNNHGICDNLNKTCMCNTNWTGVDCLTYMTPNTEPIKPPAPVPVKTACEECCSNACNTQRGLYNTNSCNCNQCIRGSYCCVKNISCLNGLCVNGSCVCESGYYRENCSERCPWNCHNGYCSGDKCICKTGWTGTDCSAPSCSQNCNLNGYCNKGICSCYVGWRGVDCSEVKCPNDCSGLGTCINNSCQCSPGYSGVICELLELQSRCQGVWTNQQCKCLEGQYGPYCVTCENCLKSCPDECKQNDGGTHSNSAEVGVIVGSILGTIGFLLILLYCYCKYYRKNNLEKRQQYSIQHQIPIPNNNNTVVLQDQIVNVQHNNHDINNGTSSYQVIQARQNKAHNSNNNVVSKKIRYLSQLKSIKIQQHNPIIINIVIKGTSNFTIQIKSQKILKEW